jgi:pyridinium-3,5-biscarboxylic acid mononucleotide synthase
MQEDRIEKLLQQVAAGEKSIPSAMDDLKHMPFEDLGFAKVDHHRHLRQGMAEVIFSPGKTAAQIVEIASRLSKHHDIVVATRAEQDLADLVCHLDSDATYIDESRSLVWGALPDAAEGVIGNVALVSAGTSDFVVAKEAELILKANRVAVEFISDVGVAGLHRISSEVDNLRRAQVCIVIAGMDGVLPSVVGGIVECPVIACPTSTGYGASFQGLAPLLTMLNSCAAGVTVVNIDNGFGAAVAAIRILRGRKNGGSTK